MEAKKICKNYPTETGQKLGVIRANFCLHLNIYGFSYKKRTLCELHIFQEKKMQKRGVYLLTLAAMKNVILSTGDRPFGQFLDYGDDNVSLSVTSS